MSRHASVERLVIGNLDLEVELAREAASAEEGGAGRPRLPAALPDGVLDLCSALATLLRAFLGTGDRLWTPRAVDPGRVAKARGLPVPELEGGPEGPAGSAARVLAWGESKGTAAVRARLAGPSLGPTGPGSRTSPPEVEILSPAAARELRLDEALWQLPVAAAEASLRTNDRWFCTDLATRLGVSLPGSATVRSIVEMDERLPAASEASPAGEWVLKSRLSAAGRSRLRGRGRRLDDPARRRAERLLEAAGGGVLEPWMDRVDDLGRSGLVGEASIRILPSHRSLAVAGGGYAGTEILLRDEVLSEEEREASDRVVSSAALALHAAGYRGAFTVDAFRFRGRTPEIRFHPLGEINARISFGLVARALAVRACSGDAPRARLRIEPAAGAAIPERAEPPCRRIAPLLLPHDAHPGAAWMEEDAAP